MRRTLRATPAHVTFPNAGPGSGSGLRRTSGVAETVLLFVPCVRVDGSCAAFGLFSNGADRDRAAGEQVHCSPNNDSQSDQDQRPSHLSDLLVCGEPSNRSPRRRRARPPARRERPLDRTTNAGMVPRRIARRGVTCSPGDIPAGARDRDRLTCGQSETASTRGLFPDAPPGVAAVVVIARSDRGRRAMGAASPGGSS